MSGDAAISVRTATPGDRLAVHRIVDGAMLAVEDVDDRLEAGDVLVAVRSDGGDERPRGALVSEPIDGGWEVLAIAVRRPHRGRGIGTALLEAAGEREGRLVAEFDASVRPFYESLGFAIREVGDGGSDERGDDGEAGDEKRYRGVRG